MTPEDQYEFLEIGYYFSKDKKTKRVYIADGDYFVRIGKEAEKL